MPRTLFRKRKTRQKRISFDRRNAVIYAIGDVHGCYKELKSLETKIVDDSGSFDCRKIIVMLGDYLDRGPESARVIEHLAGDPPAGFERICLLGNHEQAFLSLVDGKIPLDAWLAGGGGSTLMSYGMDPNNLSILHRKPAELIKAIAEGVTVEHIGFLRSLPIMAHAGRLVFAHAGIRPGVSLERQTDRDLLFIRDDMFNHNEQLDYWIIHGHTPINGTPRLEGRRLNIDTGAFMSGRLTAIRVLNGKGRLLFS